MTTTVQNIIDRAIDRNAANRLDSLTESTTVMIHRVNQDAIRLRQQLLDRNKTFFFQEEAKATNAAASARVLDLESLGSGNKVGRLVKVSLPSGAKVSIVDYIDRTAALAPRGYPKQKTIVEVGSEWGASGAVVLTVAYNIGCTSLVLTGATTQNVTIDDEYAWLLDNRLGAYLAAKDVGRSADEIKLLDEEYEAGVEDYVLWLSGIGGAQTLLHYPTLANPKP